MSKICILFITEIVLVGILFCLSYFHGATRLINLEIKNLVLVYKYPCLNSLSWFYLRSLWPAKIESTTFYTYLKKELEFSYFEATIPS